MLEDKIISELNGISFSIDELKEYEDWGTISDEKLSEISYDLQTSYSREKVKDIGQYVSELLLEGEYIEKTVKATDPKMLEAMMTFAAIVPVAFIGGGDIKYSHINFFTNRRIIVVGYNITSNRYITYIYDKEEIVNIRMDKSIPLYRNEKNKKKSEYARWELMNSVMPIIISFVALFYPYYLFKKATGFNNGIVETIVGLTCMFLGYHIGRYMRPRGESEVIIEMKDGKKFDFFIRNYNYREIKNYLKYMNK
ncbi:hypothetical protein [Clostridium sp. 'White wine YQ']|uniref:hypothetical protein n=1 Tax=Clostridium sp. 'White wine YQ' TaxID=3027474 RepID=UPI0023662C49|nr:hypothetical protein [Clostridium sp. 'White wine YQ']MDD7794996.1 hypothetical protein [Clostridium sp. 'White wine YQ']